MYPPEIPIAWNGKVLDSNLTIYIAGRTYSYEFAYFYDLPPDGTIYFHWDGKDVYGRDVYGPRIATVRLGFQYYFDLGNGNGFKYWVWNQKTVPLMGHYKSTLGIQGWSLSVHHFNAFGKIILGNGRNQISGTIGPRLITVAGIAGNDSITAPEDMDGGIATEMNVSNPESLALGKDGALYISDTGTKVVWKLLANGRIVRYAGNGKDVDTFGHYSGDGGPAMDAVLGIVRSIALGLDDSLYIATRNGTIRKVDKNGIITTIAGIQSGSTRSDYNNTSAVNKWIPAPKALFIDENGDIYYASFKTIEKIDTNGIITTLAGNYFEDLGYSGDGGPAIDASLNRPEGIVKGSDGSIYFSDTGNQVIRKIDKNGIITTIAGTGDQDYYGDGGLAKQAAFATPKGITIDANGNLYVADYWNSLIRKIDKSGIVTTIAGNGASDLTDKDGEAKSVSLAYPTSVVASPDGSLYVSQYARVRKIVSSAKNFKLDESYVLSENGDRIYHFDSAGRHLETWNALTSQPIHTFKYTDNGLLSKIEEPYNQSLRLERDAKERVTAIISAYGDRTELVNDGNDNLIEVRYPDGSAWNFEYTELGLMTAATRPNGHRSFYEYANDRRRNGLLVKATDPAGGYKNLEFHEGEKRGEYNVTRTTAMGRTVTFGVTMKNGNERERFAIDANGLKATTTIKADGTYKLSPNGTETIVKTSPDPRFGYGKPVVSNVTTMTPGGLTKNIQIKRSVMLSDSSDLLSLQKMKVEKSINDRMFIVEQDVENGKVVTTSPEGRKRIMTLDDKGNIVSRRHGTLKEVDYEYDSQGRLIRITQGERQAALSYDAKGRISSITDALNRSVSYEYDEMGRIVKKQLHDGNEVIYTYDEMGNLLSLTPPGKPSHDFIYTLVEKVETYTPPSVSNSGVTQYHYNKDRQLTRIERPMGEIVYEYDKAGKLQKMGDITISYDPSTGNVASLESGYGINLTLVYDGSLLTGMSMSGEVRGNMKYRYDNNFWVTEMVINDSETIGFQYDNDGLLSNAGVLDVTRGAENGEVKSTKLDSLTESMDYNEYGELASYSLPNLFETSYSRDKVGRIIEIEEIIENGTADTYEFQYDASGCLATVVKNGTTIGQYDYDANGNRISANGIAATYDEQDRLLTYGTFRYSYTTNGEIASRFDTNTSNSTQYRYDIFGNLKKVILPDNTVIEYIFDGNNRRVGKKVNGTLVQGFLYMDALAPMAELDGNNDIVSIFVYGTRHNVPDYMIKNGTTYKIVSDHLGSVRLVVNATDGTVVQRIDYDVWGNVLTDTNPEFQPFGYAGGLYDRDVQLVHFGARDYDPQIGRWMTKDPLGLNVGTNMYRYVKNDPINKIDPTGKACSDNITDQYYDLLRQLRRLLQERGEVNRIIRSLDGYDADEIRQQIHDMYFPPVDGMRVAVGMAELIGSALGADPYDATGGELAFALEVEMLERILHQLEALPGLRERLHELNDRISLIEAEIQAMLRACPCLYDQ